MSQYKLVRFNLNGKDVEKMVDVRASLTDMLRNDYHMTSVKKGCEVGECGACNVIIQSSSLLTRSVITLPICPLQPCIIILVIIIYPPLL